MRADHQDRTGRTSTLVDDLIARARLRRVDLRLGERVDALDIEQGRVKGVATTHERLAAAAVIWTADPWLPPGRRTAGGGARAYCVAICGGCNLLRRRR